MAGVAFQTMCLAVLLQQDLILPAHTSTVALQAISGMAASVWQAVMKVQVGQIQQPGPEAIVNPLQAAAVLIPIGTMAVVLAALPHTPVPILLGIILQPVPVLNALVAAMSGLIGEHALVDPAAIPIPALLTTTRLLPVLVQPALTG